MEPEKSRQTEVVIDPESEPGDVSRFLPETSESRRVTSPNTVRGSSPSFRSRRHDAGQYLPLRPQSNRLCPCGAGPPVLLPDAHQSVAGGLLLPAQRSARCLRRPRCSGSQSVHKVWSHAGHVDGPLCHHVSPGQPVAALPVLHLPVPGQHVSGHLQPLAAPAQLDDQGIHQPQEHRPLGERPPAALLHLQAGAVRDVSRERALLLPALHPASPLRACCVALLAAGTVWDHLPAQVRHQPGAPHHRLPEHGRPGRRRASGEHEAAVSESSAARPRFNVLLLLN